MSVIPSEVPIYRDEVEESILIDPSTSVGVTVVPIICTQQLNCNKLLWSACLIVIADNSATAIKQMSRSAAHSGIYLIMMANAVFLKVKR